MSILALLLGLTLPLAAPLAGVAPATRPATRPVAEASPDLRPKPLARRVLIVSIDGLRPDLAMRADMPNLRALMDRGTYSLWCETTPAAVTTPSHTSMLTGVTIERHGVTINGDQGTTRPIYPDARTIFEHAGDAGLLTAVAVEKVKIAVINRPGAVGTVVLGDSSDGSDETWERYVADVVGLVADHRPDVLFWHIGRTDKVGHATGWGSPEQIVAIEEADAALGRVLAAYESAGLTGETAVIVSADHGGRGRVHGADDPMSRYIPWVVAGPGVRRGVDLTSLVAPVQVRRTTRSPRPCTCSACPCRPTSTAGR